MAIKVYSSSERLLAHALSVKLAMMSNTRIPIDNILSKCSAEELCYYYRKICIRRRDS